MQRKLMSGLKHLTWEKTFSDAMPIDPIRENYTRTVKNAVVSFVRPQKFPSPSAVIVSEAMAEKLGIPFKETESEEFVKLFIGETVLENASPFATCYGGHQFGSWASQLGDGRAITLGELRVGDKLYDVQLKGCGKTPYSRFADGKAVLRSCIREYLCSEAMFYLGVPTSRALAVLSTGEKVIRDILYNGNAKPEPGATCVRVAESFIRFGHFEIFATQHNKEITEKILDYTIDRNFPDLKSQNKPTRYFNWLERVINLTAILVAHWQAVGFVHGVLNTDNMSILGETIDFGPFGFLENFDPDWTPNTTDAEMHRYTYQNQPDIGLWNLSRLTAALNQVLNDTEKSKVLLQKYKTAYFAEYGVVFRKKLGFDKIDDKDLGALIEKLHKLLEECQIDFTIFYREFANFDIFNKWKDFQDFLKTVGFSFYNQILVENKMGDWMAFLLEYKNKLAESNQTLEQRKKLMDSANPKYILRNWMLQQAINESATGNNTMLQELNEMIKTPYEDRPEFNKFYQKRPDWAKSLPGYSMLSCSS